MLTLLGQLARLSNIREFPMEIGGAIIAEAQPAPGALGPQADAVQSTAKRSRLLWHNGYSDFTRCSICNRSSFC
jgi:hypothetical protein